MNPNSTLTRTETSSQTKKKERINYFHIGIMAPLTQGRNAENFFKAAEGLCELGFSLIVLAIGDQTSQSKCIAMSERYGEQFELLEDIPKNRERLMMESEVMCFMSSPTEKDLKAILDKSIVPVMPQMAGFENFSAQKESGNAFFFNPENHWTLVASLIRAFENFQFAYDWKNLQKNVKKTEIN